MSTDLFIFLREEAAGTKDDFFCEVAKEVRISTKKYYAEIPGSKLRTISMFIIRRIQYS